MQKKVSLLFWFISMFMVLLPTFSYGQFILESDTEDQTIIVFNMPDYNIIQANNVNKGYKVIETSKHNYRFDEGLPNLPFYNTTIQIPDLGDVTFDYSILESETIENTAILPYFEDVPILSNSTVKQEENNQWYPEDEVLIGEPAIMRNKRLINIMINSFRYNNNKQELQVLKKVKIIINYNRSRTGVNQLISNNMGSSNEFEDVFRANILNYENHDNRSEFQNPSILYIYNSTATENILATLNVLVEWRRELGWKVRVFNCMNLTKEEIKAYIQECYYSDINPITHVTIFGDNGIPSYFEDIEREDPTYVNSDHPYTLLSGNDYLSDIFLSRMYVNDDYKAAVFVNKIISYEKQDIVTNTDWFNKNILVSAINQGVDGTVISSVFTNQYVNEIMLSYNPAYENSVHDYNLSTSSIMDDINDGCLFFNYRGDETILNLHNYLGNQLANYNKLPILVLYTDSSLTYSNRFGNLMTVIGTPDTQLGSPAVFGMDTDDSHTAYNNILSASTMEYFFVNDGWYCSSALNNAKLRLWQTYNIHNPQVADLQMKAAALNGDAAMKVWKGVPKDMDVSCDNIILVGSDQFEVSVMEGNQALKDVWATIKIGDETYSTYTDSRGIAMIEFAMESGEDVLLTLSKEGYRTQQMPLSIEEIEESIIIENTSLYSNNQECDFLLAQSSYDLELELKNTGTILLQDVEVTITCDSEDINFDAGQLNFGDLACGETGLGNFSFSVFSINNDKAIKFDILIESGDRSWNKFIYFDTQTPIIEIDPQFVTNSYNFFHGIVDFRIVNNGNQALNNGLATLTTSNGAFTITDSSFEFNALDIDSTLTLNYSISSIGNIYLGTIVPFELEIEGDGYHTVLQTNASYAYPSQTQPTGPDPYGYVIYDSYDTNYEECPNYEWIDSSEIDNGTYFELDFDYSTPEENTVQCIEMPFTFSFYGVEYDSISVCANGWLSFGYSEQASFRNWSVPGPLGPSPMLAVFWDDLEMEESSSCNYVYDIDNHCVIITWQDVEIYNNVALITFQAILYDPDYYDTSTNDGPIKLQYQDIWIFEVNQHSGGNYVTVGTEDHTSQVGLEYTFNNQYPVTAHQLEDNFALYITTETEQKAPIAIAEISDIYIDEDSEFSGLNTINLFRDPNNDDFEIFLANTEHFTMTINEANIATISPTEDWYGVEEVTLCAQDDFNPDCGEISFTMNVNPINDRPVLLNSYPEESDLISEVDFFGFGVDVYDPDNDIDYTWKINDTIIEGETTDTLYYYFEELGIYNIKCYATDGMVTIMTDWNITVTTDNEVEYALVNSLSQNIPNPFNPSTAINFSIKNSSKVSLIIYNIKGQKVKTLVSDRLEKGNHTVVWKGNDDNNQKVSSGIYFYRLITDEFQSTRKAIMLK